MPRYKCPLRLDTCRPSCGQVSQALEQKQSALQVLLRRQGGKSLASLLFFKERDLLWWDEKDFCQLELKKGRLIFGASCLSCTCRCVYLVGRSTELHACHLAQLCETWKARQHEATDHTSGNWKPRQLPQAVTEGVVQCFDRYMLAGLVASTRKNMKFNHEMNGKQSLYGQTCTRMIRSYKVT